MAYSALITGGTGDIGGAFAEQLLAKGYDLYTPHRRGSEKKLEKFAVFGPRIHATPCDLADTASVQSYLGALHRAGVVPDVIILAAGGRGPNGEFFDSEFPGATQHAREQAACAALYEVNVRTKETFLAGLRETFGGALQGTALIMIGSHAAGFGPGHPFRTDEEGYVQAMVAVRALAEAVRAQGVFQTVTLVEPGLVEGDLTAKKFPELIRDATVPRISAQALAHQALTDTGR